MSVFSTFADWFAYSRWINRRLLTLCEPLDAAALDRVEPIGPGSLRGTLAHVWGAEHLWLERWRGFTPTAIPTLPDNSIGELRRRYEAVHADRTAFLAREIDTIDRVVTYRNLAGQVGQHRLVDLLLHVFNHGVHHRAQIMQFLRLAGITVPGGIDYLFFRIAFPTVLMPSELIGTLKNYGLEVATHPVDDQPAEPNLVRRYTSYNDWAMQRVLGLAKTLAPADLDREFAMGIGSVRKNLLHLVDVENWWRGNWAGVKKPFAKLPVETSIEQIENDWNSVSRDRNAFLANADESTMSRVVEADFGAGAMNCRIGESAVQLCVHGTHHRAQAINMLRRIGLNVPGFDLVIWLRETEA